MQFSGRQLCIMNYALPPMSLRPIIEIISVDMKNSLQNVAGSLKHNMPTITVPTAPMPVHTGYAVPIGIVCTAFARSVMLRVRHARNPRPQRHHGVPDNPFILPRQNAKPVSKHPAIISRIQFISQKKHLKLKKFIVGGCVKNTFIILFIKRVSVTAVTVTAVAKITDFIGLTK